MNISYVYFSIRLNKNIMKKILESIKLNFLFSLRQINH